MHSLQQLGLAFGTDKATRHRYCDTYEQLLPRDVSELWELGILKGASLNMWAAYYPNAKIIGFDIVDKSGIKFLPNVETHLLDQSNIYALNAVGDTRGIHRPPTNQLPTNQPRRLVPSFWRRKLLRQIN